MRFKPDLIFTIVKMKEYLQEQSSRLKEMTEFSDVNGNEASATIVCHLRQRGNKEECENRRNEEVNSAAKLKQPLEKTGNEKSGKEGREPKSVENYKEKGIKSKMAIDLPETIPSIINSFKRSNSAKALQRLTRNLRSCEKSPRFPFFKTRSEQCRCSFPNCKECQKRLKSSCYSENECQVNKLFIKSQKCDSNNDSENEADCEQTLLSEVDTKADLNFGRESFDWKFGENDVDAFGNKYWKGTKSGSKTYLGDQDDDEILLNSSDRLRRNRRKVFLLSSIGLVLLSFAIFIKIADPLELILDWKLSLAPGSFVLSLWLEPPVRIYVKIYIFNISNPMEFLSGKEKLRVSELGPFVYAEHLMNTNPVFNENGTLTYIPKRTVKFVPEMSVSNPKNQSVTVPNIPYLGIASMIANSTMITNLAYLTLSKYLGSQPFLNLTVHDYLWGYDDPLVKIANRIVTNWIPFSKFGLLDRMYDEGKNLITLRLTDNGLDVTDKGYLMQYSIDNWNGSPGLEAWGYREAEFSEHPVRPEPEQRCKLIRGATEGVLFPRNVSREVVLQVYRKTFCRIMPVVFDKAGIAENGIPAYWYKLPEDVFATPDENPAQACYCNPNMRKCLPSGLSDITPCYYNIPAAVSFPHFLGGDPKLINSIDGLNPNKDIHGTTIILQPDLGMPMDVKTRIQTNLIMNKIRYNTKITPFSDLALPLFWAEVTMDGLPNYIIVLLYLVVYIIPVLQTSFMVISFIAGIILLIYSVITFLLIKGILPFDEYNKSKYSSIKIAPIVSKSHIVNLSRKNSIISAMNISRKNSIISTHKNFVNI